MIRSFTLENFGPVQKIEANGLGKINLILAENAEGKTFILKALYVVMKSYEEAHKGENNRSFQEELRDKLYWAFQTDQISNLINKGNIGLNDYLKVNITLENNQSISFSLEGNEGKENQIKILDDKFSKRDANSIFLPPKEVFSLFNVIKYSAYQKWFGFDVTYVDLVKALDQINFEKDEILHQSKSMLDVLDAFSLQLGQLEGILNQHHPFLLEESELQGKKSELQNYQNEVNNLKEVIQSSGNLISNLAKDKINKSLGNNDYSEQINMVKKIFDGSINYHEDKREWLYEKEGNDFAMNITAEGIKKVLTLQTLLQNGFLTRNSIIFIDEPEANLHPKAVSQFLDILFSLSQSGMQIFMATHSYFVIKKMCLLAKQNNESIPVLMSKEKNGKVEWIQENLKDGMPENEIINESIRLFEEEADLITGWNDGN